MHGNPGKELFLAGYSFGDCFVIFLSLARAGEVWEVYGSAVKPCMLTPNGII